MTNEQKQKFLPLCPDFAIELLSPSDELSKTPDKMQEYLDNGMKLGWLINSQNQQVEIYRQGKQVEILDRLRDFSLSSASLFRPKAIAFFPPIA